MVAYTVGKHNEHGLSNGNDSGVGTLNILNSKSSSSIPPKSTVNRAPLASPDSSRSIMSQLEEARPPDPPSTGHQNYNHEKIKQLNKNLSLGTITLATTEDLDPLEGCEEKVNSNFTVTEPNLTKLTANKENLSPNTSHVANNNSNSRQTLIETVV